MGWKFDVRRADSCWFEACRKGRRSYIKQCVGSGCVDVTDVDSKGRNGLHYLWGADVSSRKKLELFVYVFLASEKNSLLLLQRDHHGVQPLSRLWELIERVEEKYGCDDNCKEGENMAVHNLARQVRGLIEEALEKEWMDPPLGSNSEEEEEEKSERSFQDRLSDAFREDAMEFGEGGMYHEWKRYEDVQPKRHHSSAPSTHDGTRFDGLSDDEYAAYIRKRMHNKKYGISEEESERSGKRGNNKKGKRRGEHLKEGLKLKREKDVDKEIELTQQLAEISHYVERCDAFFDRLKERQKKEKAGQHIPYGDIPFPSKRVQSYLLKVIEDMTKKQLTRLGSSGDAAKPTVSSSSSSITTQSSSTLSATPITPEDNIRILVKKSQRWWHPDMWMSKYASLIEHDNKEEETHFTKKIADDVLVASKFFNDLRSKTSTF
eukprot:m.94741 g.94741  ORF g.94741 m.94741 type:complete len:434 (-) comp8930_c0_seq3:3291-4592(-)